MNATCIWLQSRLRKQGDWGERGGVPGSLHAHSRSTGEPLLAASFDLPVVDCRYAGVGDATLFARRYLRDAVCARDNHAQSRCARHTAPRRATRSQAAPRPHAKICLEARSTPHHASAEPERSCELRQLPLRVSHVSLLPLEIESRAKPDRARPPGTPGARLRLKPGHGRREWGRRAAVPAETLVLLGEEVTRVPRRELLQGGRVGGGGVSRGRARGTRGAAVRREEQSGYARRRPVRGRAARCQSRATRSSRLVPA